MSCWALIPLKTPGLGKTRLSAQLSGFGRKKLVETMLADVLDALTASRYVDHVAIVGMSPLHCPPGVMHIADPGRGLNAALTHARQQLQAAGASELLVMHADLPLVESSEIDEFVLCGRRQQVALASDHHGLGTNAIYLRQPQAFAFSFGRRSLARHMAQAEALNLKPALNKARGLRFDLDTVQDLNCLQNVTLPFGRPQPSAHWSQSHA